MFIMKDETVIIKNIPKHRKKSVKAILKNVQTLIDKENKDNNENGGDHAKHN